MTIKNHGPGGCCCEPLVTNPCPNCIGEVAPNSWDVVISGAVVGDGRFLFEFTRTSGGGCFWQFVTGDLPPAVTSYLFAIQRVPESISVGAFSSSNLIITWQLGIELNGGTTPIDCSVIDLDIPYLTADPGFESPSSTCTVTSVYE